MMDSTVESQPLTALEAGAVACHAVKWSLSNLKLQKVLYIAEVLYLGQGGDVAVPLIEDDFYAWRFGPVLPDLYREIKGFGAFAVTPTDSLNWDMIPASPECERCHHIAAVARALVGVGVFKLVDMTHDPKGAWYRVYYKCDKALRPSSILRKVMLRAEFDDVDYRSLAPSL